MDPWNRAESLEINTCVKGRVIFNEGGRANGGKDDLSNKGLWENGACTCKTTGVGSSNILERPPHKVSKNRVFEKAGRALEMSAALRP